MNAKESEHKHQVELFKWAALNANKYPQLALMHAIPNGGPRGNDVRSNMIRGASLKAEGVRAGVPDIFLPVARHGCHGMYIEMKKPSAKPKRSGKGGVSDEQRGFIEALTHEGYLAVVCYGWAEAVTQIHLYLGA